LVAALLAEVVINDAVAEAPKGVVAPDQLEERDEVHYFEGKPFTGVAVKKYRGGGNWQEFTYKDGDLMSAVVWKPNGEKCPHTNIVDGNGVVVGYKDNGNEQYRFFYQDGKRAF